MKKDQAGKNQSRAKEILPSSKWEEQYQLAEDAKLSPEWSGFAGITIAYNTKTEAEVDEVMTEVKGLGAEIVKAPEKVFWGGYSGYFKDLDGHLFEVAYSPFAEFDDLDQLVMQLILILVN